MNRCSSTKPRRPKRPPRRTKVRQHFVRDRFFGDEAVPGEFGEAPGTGRMLGGLDGERRVADNSDERRDDHELEQAEVVDLGDLQLTHAVEQRRAPLLLSSASNCSSTTRSRS